jgi:hypothetical protein
VVGASGGALQLTPNVSLFRLTAASVETVLAEREAFAALGMVEFELLPHLNRLDAGLLEAVRVYSQATPAEVVALADGAAVIVAGGEARCSGEVVRFPEGSPWRPGSPRRTPSQC